MIRGLGVDLVDLLRFQRIFTRDKKYIDRFTTRILHPHELDKLKHLRDNTTRIRYVAGSWASKEAVFKTLDLTDQKSFAFNQWYRFNDENGKPHITSQLYCQNNNDDQFLLSISHDKNMLIATVIRQTLKRL